MSDKTSRDSRTAVVKVQVLVETTVGSWGADCTIGQAEQQASETALRQVQRILGEHNVRVVRVVGTDVHFVKGTAP